MGTERVVLDATPNMAPMLATSMARGAIARTRPTIAALLVA